MKVHNKPFRSFENQVNILKSRNLKFKDDEKAQYILSQINYYTLINGYKNIFLDKEADCERYRDKTTFEEIYALHELDRELKMVLLKHLLRFEKVIKTSCAYHFSQFYDGIYPYLQIENYSNNKYKLKNVLKNISTLSNIINNEVRHINGKKQIKHYVNRYEDIPLWVLVNCMTFGNMSYFYSSLKEDLQNEIAKDFGFRFKYNYKSYEKIGNTELIEILKLSNYFRNICAHDEVLFSFKLKKSGQTAIFRKFFTHKYKGKNLFDLILVLKLVLDKEDYRNLIESIEKIKSDFKDKFKSISIDEIFKVAGFYEQDLNNLI
ncbi:MAG: Abi family protein [Tissierellia bacterium]|nr:Abi family protein [Tissierellia bacterium]